ncbi:FeoC-like transcriptional regulator [Thioalkalivibrio sp. XN279]|uniref:FeoC-like transcriptional regulator n=1 Tax=Thioalkalivibrio sp. XN279 TaxID=2714953 RepID=UPI00140D42FC|nr:FeoC-like transcriptional regulator [Thioalkalivibrio sp. XN279]NHA15648.1 sugar metabolism transcriptional regulator [Thioalkalivibrio sp. XN279]
MLMSRLHDYLAKRGRASLREIALGVEADPGALRGMLSLLERKGCVRRLAAGGKCAACTRCPLGSAEVYEWCASTTK